MPSGKNVTIVGAGVAGLTTALILSKREDVHITILAKHMPGDESIEYTSPWAGANYLPVSLKNTRASKWDEATWPFLWDLAKDTSRTGVGVETCFLWNRDADLESSVTSVKDWANELQSDSPWFSKIVPEFRTLSQEELQPGFDSGTVFKTICINVPVYLDYLVSLLKEQGVEFRRGVLKHISEAAGYHHSGQQADVVVNCTGIMASQLGGVEDKAVYPARGQICIVSNRVSAMATTSGTDGGPPDRSDVFYVQPRPLGGTVIGGSYQKNDWSAEFDPDLAGRMMERAVQWFPELTGGEGPEKLNVIRHTVGLRPCREGGTRVEKELIGDIWVVHNYGHGGFGYQSSYGCSLDAATLVEDALDERRSPTLQS